MSVRIPKPVYEHQQTSFATQWPINHLLGYRPNCDVIVEIDGVRNTVYPSEIVYESDNHLSIYFTTPQAGIARLF